MFDTNPLIQYSYDGLDNLKRIIGRGKDLTYVYDGRNRLTNVTQTIGGATVVGLGYHVQGNLQSKSGQPYVFDYGNRLRAATGQESYRYDGAGRRVMANAGNGLAWSLYGLDGALRFQQDDRTGHFHDYVYLAGSLVAKRTTTEFAGGTVSTTYQHTDALGTPVAVTDESRALVERSEYDPYGALMNRPLIDGPGYTGHVQDAVTGLTYMQQRYYDPQIGRFLSVDPVTADGSTGDNFNRYWYASNNPYRFYDPDGRQDAEARERKDWRSVDAYSSNRTDSAKLSTGTTSGVSSGKASAAPKSAQEHADAYWNKGLGGDWRGAMGEMLGFISSSWSEAFSTPESSILTVMSVVPGVGPEAGLARAELQAARSLGANPFKGKNASEIASVLTQKGYVPKGPDPAAGRGTFVNPRTGRGYHIDAAHPAPKGPHVGVHRPRDMRDRMAPRDYPLGD